MTKAGYIEYKMPELVAKEYLKARTGEDKKINANKYLCKIVDEEFGLLGKCMRVIKY